MLRSAVNGSLKRPRKLICLSRAASTNLYDMDVTEVTTFQSLADRWWDRYGSFKALHAMNSLRVQLVNDAFKGQSPKPWFPLYGKQILDVGCGGGILSEPLARLGAKVLGVDTLPEGVAAAKDHANTTSPKQWAAFPHGAPEYRTMTMNDAAVQFPHEFDAVIASEMLEHVTNWREIVKDISVCLKPGGHFIATTLNRTILSYCLGIFAAENILNLAPRGTHTWEKFIDPQDLQLCSLRYGLQPRKIVGMTYCPLSNEWMWFSSRAINYAFHAVKVDTPN